MSAEVMLKAGEALVVHMPKGKQFVLKLDRDDLVGEGVQITSKTNADLYTKSRNNSTIEVY